MIIETNRKQVLTGNVPHITQWCHLIENIFLQKKVVFLKRPPSVFECFLVGYICISQTAAT